MTDSVKFQLETANKKAEEFSTHIDRNMLYQVILMFVSFLIFSDPVKFTTYKFTELLSLDANIVLKIVPFLLIYLFLKLGLSLKRYNDLRVYLDEKSNAIDGIADLDKILLFTTHTSAEMFYSLRKYSGANVNIINKRLRSQKTVGIFNIQIFSILLSLFFGLSNSMTIWLLYAYIKPVYLSGIIIFIFCILAFFSYRDFVKTTENNVFKKLIYQTLVFIVLGLGYFIWEHKFVSP